MHNIDHGFNSPTPSQIWDKRTIIVESGEGWYRAQTQNFKLDINFNIIATAL